MFQFSLAPVDVPKPFESFKELKLEYVEHSFSSRNGSYKLLAHIK